MGFVTVDDTGVTAVSLDSAQTLVEQRLAQIFGPELDLAAQTPQGQMAGLMAVFGVEVGESTVALANQMTPDTATGVWLDWHGALVNVFRQTATRSRVTATLRGADGTVVRAGSRARTAAGDSFETVEDVTLTPAGVTVEMVAAEDGPTPIPAGGLSDIVTVVNGWESVTNVNAGAVGLADQTDVSYRLAIARAAARNGLGAVAAMTGAVIAAGALETQILENPEDTAVISRQFRLPAHGAIVAVRGGTDIAIGRAVEGYRGMGVPMVTAIKGGPPNSTDLAAISAGQVTWAGVDYGSIDLSSATSGADRAAALTSAMAGSGVTVRFFDDRYVAMFTWKPNVALMFDSGTTATAFGLDPVSAVGSPGPFVRHRDRPLTLVLAVTKQVGFPADGLNLIRRAVTAVVDGYPLGAQLWANDLLAAVERVPGTRVTSLSVQHDSADVSGVDVPLDARWTLPAANVTITIT